MDDPLHIIRALYPDDTSGDDADASRRRIAEDPELQRELESLKAVKDVLDRRSPDGPDPGVVDNIVAAAGRAARGEDIEVPSRARTEMQDKTSPAERPRPDRAPRRSDSASRQDWMRRTAATLVLLLAVGTAWWQLAPSTLAPSDVTPPDVLSSTQSETAPIPPPPAAPAPTSDRTASSSLPEWDEGDDVVQLQRRLDLLRARSTPSRWSIQPASQPMTP